MASLAGAALLGLLPPAAAEDAVLAEVAVTASRSGALELRRSAAAGKLVYDREDLEALDAASVGDLLRKLPGTGAFADPDNRRGRGKGKDRHMPQILVDGQPLPGGDASPGTALRLPADLVERVEIIRNSTAEFPVAGPAGVINLILRDVPPRATGSARLGAGAAEDAAVVRLEGQLGNREADFGYLLGGSAQRQPLLARQTTDIQRFSGGVRDDWQRERIEESGRDGNLALTPRFHWTLGDGRQFTLSPFFNLTDTARDALVRRYRYADPAAGTGLAPAGRDLEREEGRRGSGRLNAEWKTLLPGGGEWLARLTAQGEFEERDKAVRCYDAAAQATGRDDEATRRYEREGAALLRGKGLVLDSHFLTGAVEWRGRTGDESRRQRRDGVLQDGGAGDRAALDDRRAVVWLQDEWQLADAHLLTPGLRWQRQHSAVTDGLGTTVASRHRSLDPSLHYLWQPDPAWNLRASVARQDKPPHPRDLSPVVRTASGNNTSGNPDKAGNPALAAESTVGIEAGVEHFLPGRAGTVGLSLFHRRVANRVQKLVQFDGSRWVERPYNVGDAEQRGALLDFKWRADGLGLPDLTLRGNAAYTATRLVAPVPGLGAGEGPRRSANLGFDLDLPAQRMTLGGNLGYVGALDRESSARLSQTQGRRLQLDLYALHRIDRQLDLRLSITNALPQARSNDLEELDAGGATSRLEHDRETQPATVFLALEGKW